MNPTAESPEAAALREQCLKLLGQAIADWRVATPAWAQKIRQLVDRYHEARRQQPTSTTDEDLLGALKNREHEREAAHKARDAAEATPTTDQDLLGALKNREHEREATHKARDAAGATPTTDEDLLRALKNREHEREAAHRAPDASEATLTTDESLIRALKNREHELEASNRADDASEARRLHTALAEDLRDLAQNTDPAGLGKAASDRQTAIAFLEKTSLR